MNKSLYNFGKEKFKFHTIRTEIHGENLMLQNNVFDNINVSER